MHRIKWSRWHPAQTYLESGLLKTGKEEISQNNVDFHGDPEVRYFRSMVVRKGLSDLLSFEAGINYTKRKYELTITDRDAGFTGVSDFRINIL